MKKNSLHLFSAGILLSGTCLAQKQVVTQAVDKISQRPNIIFIYADDWGYGDLSGHGHKGLKTPNLDKMASEGLEFSQFNVCNPVCSPSRTAILTGKYPARFSIHEHFASHDLNIERGMPDWLDPHTTTLPRILKEAGYSTAHYGKWHLTNAGVSNPPMPVDYGYDDTKVFNGPGPQVEKPIGESTSACVDYTIDFMEKHRSVPFFINLWIHESHQQIEPPKEALAEYADTEEPYRHYYACITYADKQLGRLFQYLKENKLDDKTLVIFSSDNGPEQSSENSNNKLWYSRGKTGGLKGYKRSLFEGGVGVPFIVRLPGKVPAGVTNNTTNLAGVDVLPTLCTFAGVKLPIEYVSDGEDLSNAFLGKPIKRTKPLFWEWRGTNHDLDWPRLAVRLGDWKLLSNYDGSQHVLFNIQENREEINDLSSSHPEKVKELFKLVTDWKATLPEKPDSTCIANP